MLDQWPPVRVGEAVLALGDIEYLETFVLSQLGRLLPASMGAA